MSLRDRNLVPEKQQRSPWKLVLPIGLALVSAWAIRAGVHTFFLAPVVVSESSMEPGLKQGEVRYAHRRFLPSELHPGDLIWMEHPLSPGYRMIRKIVAREGDTVEVRQGTILVNGTVVFQAASPSPQGPQDSPEAGDAKKGNRPKDSREHTDRSAEEQASFFDRPPVKLPSGSFFVLSDNRGLDSRHFGSVSTERILGVIR